MTPRTPLLLGPLLLLASCGGDAKSGDPGLPPPELRPFLHELERLQRQMPVVDEATRRELHDLFEIAVDLVHTEDRIKSRAERSLLEHPSAWFALEEGLGHEDAAVRRRSAWLCGRSGEGALQLPLLLRLKYEKDPEAVVWVADALQRLGNDAGLLWLDAAMAREDTAQTAGNLAIAICNERGLSLGEPPTYEELRRAMREQHAQWKRTGRGGRPGVEPPSGPQVDARIARHLATPAKTYMRPIDDARFVLTRAGRLGLPLLERTLGASEAYLRTMALQVLVELGPCARETGPAIEALLPEPMTALYAVRAVGEVGYREALPHLRPLLHSIDTELRAAATQALGLLGDRISGEPLRALLRDESEAMDVRVGAAFALLCLGEDERARAFLDERENKGDYHAPTLARLRERLAEFGR